jgi:hypothetical protein
MRFRISRFTAAATLAAILVLACGVERADASGDLYIVFNLNHTISVTQANGAPLGTTSGPPTQIPAGSYNLHFDDSIGVSGPIFTLSGPGENMSESLTLGEYPSATDVATFQPNSTYTWWDAENPNIVFTFQTTSQSVGTPTGSDSAGGGTTSSGGGSGSQDIVGSGVSQFRGSLEATVYADGKVSLVKNGNAFTSLKSGRWTFSVDDESKKAGFSVEILHGSAKTISSKAFVGSNDVTVTLKPGRWFYFTPGGKKKQFFVTS